MQRRDDDDGNGSHHNQSFILRVSIIQSYFIFKFYILYPNTFYQSRNINAIS